LSPTKPTLWQIEISHYSEKARWALEHKDIDHVRRAPLPGMHMAVALWLTGGTQMTFPVLQLEGEATGDSTAVIAALEQRFPGRPLYPAEAGQRRRALELEDFFDEQLGPHMRLLVFHELVNEPEMFAEIASAAVPGPLGRAKGLVGAYARTYASLRFGVRSDEAATAARAKIVAALDRLEAELAANGGEYLAGESFSVADLTAASLFFPLVAPPEGPVPPDSPTPPALQSFRDGLSDRPGYLWVEEMFRRHRRPAQTGAAAPA
jgi:glutathione S-transferase